MQRAIDGIRSVLPAALGGISAPDAQTAPVAASARSKVVEGVFAAVGVAHEVRRTYSEALKSHIAKEYQGAKDSIVIQDYEDLAIILETLHNILQGSSSIAERNWRVTRGITALGWIKTFDAAHSKLESNVAKLAKSPNIARIIFPVQNLLREYKALISQANSLFVGGLFKAEQAKAFYQELVGAMFLSKDSDASKRDEMLNKLLGFIPRAQKLHPSLAEAVSKLNVVIKALWLAIDDVEIQLGLEEGTIIDVFNKMLNKKKHKTADHKKEGGPDDAKATPAKVSGVGDARMAKLLASSSSPSSSPSVELKHKKADGKKNIDVRELLGRSTKLLAGLKVTLADTPPYTKEILRKRRETLQNEIDLYTSKGLARTLRERKFVGLAEKKATREAEKKVIEEAEKKAIREAEKKAIREAVATLVDLYQINSQKAEEFRTALLDEKQIHDERIYDQIASELEGVKNYKDSKKEALANARIAHMTRLVVSAESKLAEEQSNQAKIQEHDASAVDVKNSPLLNIAKELFERFSQLLGQVKGVAESFIPAGQQLKKQVSDIKHIHAQDGVLGTAVYVYRQLDEIKSLVRGLTRDSFFAEEDLTSLIISRVVLLNEAFKQLLLAIDAEEISRGFREGSIISAINEVLNRLLFGREQASSGNDVVDERKSSDLDLCVVIQVEGSESFSKDVVKESQFSKSSDLSPSNLTEVKVVLSKEPMSKLDDAMAALKRLEPEKKQLKIDLVKDIVRMMDSLSNLVGWEFSPEERFPYTLAILRQREETLQKVSRTENTLAPTRVNLPPMPETSEGSQSPRPVAAPQLSTGAPSKTHDVSVSASVAAAAAPVIKLDVGPAAPAAASYEQKYTQQKDDQKSDDPMKTMQLILAARVRSAHSQLTQVEESQKQRALQVRQDIIVKVIQRRIAELEEEKKATFCVSGRTKQKKIILLKNMLSKIDEEFNFSDSERDMKKVFAHMRTVPDANLLFTNGRTAELMKAMESIDTHSYRGSVVEVIQKEINTLQTELNGFYLFNKNKNYDTTCLNLLKDFLEEMKIPGCKVDTALGKLKYKKENIVEAVNEEIRVLESNLRGLYVYTASKQNDQRCLDQLNAFARAMNNPAAKISVEFRKLVAENRLLAEKLEQKVEEKIKKFKTKEAKLLRKLREIEHTLGSELLDKRRIQNSNTQTCPLSKSSSEGATASLSSGDTALSSTLRIDLASATRSSLSGVDDDIDDESNDSASEYSASDSDSDGDEFTPCQARL
jgi:hypothetical protein